MDAQPVLNWIKNDKDKFTYFYDESVFLCSLEVHNAKTGITKREYFVLEWKCEDEMAAMIYHGTDEYFDQWEWSDFDYFVLISGDMPTSNRPFHEEDES